MLATNQCKYERSPPKLICLLRHVLAALAAAYSVIAPLIKSWPVAARGGLTIAILFAAITDLKAEQPEAATTVKTIILKADIRVSSEIVTIGDMVENPQAIKKKLADTGVFYAPDPGTTGTVSMATIKKHLAAAGLNNFTGNNLKQVRISRTGKAFGRPQLLKLIADYLVENEFISPTSQETLKIDLFNHVARQTIATSAEPIITDFNFASRNGYLKAAVKLDDKRKVMVRGKAMIMIDAIVTTRAIGRGELLQASDLVNRLIQRTHSRHQPLTTMQMFIGRISKKPLAAGQLLSANDVAAPYLIKRNEDITVIYEAGSMSLTIKARALENGTKGQIITVINPGSGKKIEAKVEAEGIARLISNKS